APAGRHLLSLARTRSQRTNPLTIHMRIARPKQRINGKQVHNAPRAPTNGSSPSQRTEPARGGSELYILCMCAWLEVRPGCKWGGPPAAIFLADPPPLSNGHCPKRKYWCRRV